MTAIYQCSSCGAIGAEGRRFTEITEEAVLDDFDFGEDAHPGDLHEALASVGEVMCNECGSIDNEVVDVLD